MNEQNISETITGYLLEYGPKFLAGLLMLIIGLWLISKISKFVGKIIEKRGIDKSLSKFLSSIIDVMLKILLVLAVASQIGIDTTSFIAIFSAVMVGVGMALNGTIGHFASGVMLMIFKPFRVGDVVVIGDGKLGEVKEINAFYTILKTLDNKRIIISNSNVVGNTITNISGQGNVGVELTFGIGYNDSIDKARAIILQVGKECPWVLDAPKQGVVVAELGDSSVNLATRPFCKSEHFWDTQFYMIENVKKAFDAEGISIPFPQMDVHTDQL